MTSLPGGASRRRPESAGRAAAKGTLFVFFREQRPRRLKRATTHIGSQRRFSPENVFRRVLFVSFRGGTRRAFCAPCAGPRQRA